MTTATIAGAAVPHLTGAEWTDGVGDVADTCAITYLGSPTSPGRGPITLSPPTSDTQYGPYQVEVHTVSGEERTQRVTGRIGHDFEAEIADRDDEAAIYDGILAEVVRYAALRPWSQWLEPPASAEYMRDRVAAELVRGSTLASVRQILARWGLTAVPTATLRGSVVQDGVAVQPLWPAPGHRGALTPSGRLVTAPLDLTSAIIEAHPSIETPDSANLIGDYRRRRIVGMHRLLGSTVDDPVLVRSGSQRPAVYLSPSGDLIAMVLEAHIARWRLQNSAQRLTATIWRHSDMAGIVPQRRVILSAAQTRVESPPTATWLVEQVRHQWDPERGYRVELTATRWQGFPITLRVHRQSITTPG